MTVALVFAGVVLAWLDLRATRAVLDDPLSSPGQRKAQLLFVWALPFLGALLTLNMKRRDPERSTGRYRDAPDAGDDFGESARGHRRNDGGDAAPGDSGDGGPGD